MIRTIGEFYEVWERRLCKRARRQGAALDRHRLDLVLYRMEMTWKKIRSAHAARNGLPLTEISPEARKVTIHYRSRFF